MNAPAAAFPPARVEPNAWNAFGGILRLTSRRFFAPVRWLAFAGILAVFFWISMSFVKFGNESSFYDWVYEFYLTVAVPLFSFIFAAGAIRDDLKPESVDYVFTRPVWKPSYVAFRFIAHVICVQVDFLLAFAVLVGVGAARGIPDLASAAPFLLFGQVATIAAFSAFGMLCGVLTNRYVIVGLIYGMVVEVGVGHIPTQLNQISITHGIKTLLQPLRARALGEEAITPELLPTIGLLVAFTAVSLAAAALFFAIRENAGERTGNT